MNKIVVVTGVTRGIGRQIAIDLAKSGYIVVGLFKENEAKAKELESLDSKIKTIKCDISDFKTVSEISDKIISEYGSVYGIVNNAGVAKTSLFTDVCEDDFDKIFDTNVKGTFAVIKTLVPCMIKQKQGKIVNISSIWGIHGGSCEVVYSASKAAIIGLTKALARELGPSGINVNCVAPGVIKTDMLDNLTDTDLKQLADETALMRIGNCKDVSNVVSFLLSEESDYITGQVLTVDGGMI